LQAWYNGHYNKTATEEYEMDEYPIPVTSMKDLCDVEISLDTVTVTTKRKRVDVLGDPLDEYSGMEFEVYGVENYLDDYLLSGISTEGVQNKIRKSQVRELGFSFVFSFETNATALCAFIEQLGQKGFYY
jgi:hypothetical protein